MQDTLRIVIIKRHDTEIYDPNHLQYERQGWS